MAIYGNYLTEASINNKSINFEPGGKYEISVLGFTTTVEISDNIKEKDKQLLGSIHSCLSIMNSMDLWKYLYKIQRKAWDDISNDEYFNGKKITSPNDLKKSIDNVVYIDIIRGTIEIYCTCWWDEEHGCKINFPDGKFVKSKYDSFEYQRDKDTTYIN